MKTAAEIDAEGRIIRVYTAAQLPYDGFLPELIELIWNRMIDPGRCSTSNFPSSKPPTLQGHGRTAGNQGPTHRLDTLPNTCPRRRSVPRLVQHRGFLRRQTFPNAVTSRRSHKRLRPVMSITPAAIRVGFAP